MEFANASNYEHTIFEETTFTFNCFHIYGTNTLPHWHNHLEMVLPLSDICNVFINGLNYKVSHGELVLIPPGSLHSIFPVKKSEYIAIVVGDSLLEGLNSDTHFFELFSPFMSVGRYMPIVLSSCENPFKKCYELAGELINENIQKKGRYQARIKSLIIQFFSELYDNMPKSFFENFKVSDSTLLIKSSLDYIKNHYSERISVKDMSEFCHLSIQHFCRLFKSYTGKTIVEYLTLFRLEQARKILTGTDIPIIQIPDLVGFCNGNYFSRIYKKYYGHPPSRDRLR